MIYWGLMTFALGSPRAADIDSINSIDSMGVYIPVDM
jgi:hypothetical protein